MIFPKTGFHFSGSCSSAWLPALTFRRDFWQDQPMKATMLPDRGVVKVAGDDARKFLGGLLTLDLDKVTPQAAGFGALLTPQGKIIVDCIVAEVPPEDGAGLFLD